MTKYSDSLWQLLDFPAFDQNFRVEGGRGARAIPPCHPWSRGRGPDPPGPPWKRRVWGLAFQVWGVGLGVEAAPAPLARPGKEGVEAVACGVWGVGFGGWGLVYRIRSLGFRVDKSGGRGLRVYLGVRAAGPPGL